jgi:hypothetical protein
MEADAPKPAGAAGAEWFTPGRFAALLGAALVVAFPKVALGLHSFFYRDFGVLAYPFAWFQHESFWRGELPLWNPYSHCGAPFLAQWGTNLYPGALIYLLFPLPWSLNYFCLAHLFLAGMGLYALAKRWTGDGFAASVAGLAYVFNGVAFSCLLWPNYTVALGWMPWVVLCVERSWAAGGRAVVWAAVVAALQLLSGVPEIILLTWLLVGTLWLREWTTRGAARLALVKRLFVVVLLAAGLTAAQLLPFFDLLAHSQRDTAFGTSKWAMPVWGWANLLVPLFHCFQTPQGVWFQQGQEFLSSYYLGGGPLLLALWAAGYARERRVWLLGGLALGCLVLALGERGHVFTWVKRLIPLVGIARYPVKFLLLTAFLAPLLAAWAVAKQNETACEARKFQRPVWWLAAVMAGATAVILWVAKSFPFPYDQWPATLANGIGRLVFLGLFVGALWLLAHPARRRGAQFAVLALIVADTLTHVPAQNPTLPASALTAGLWDQDSKPPPPKLGEGRVLISAAAEKQLLGSMVADNWQDYLGKRLAEWSNLNVLDRVPKVNGAATLQLRAQKEIEARLYAPTNQPPPSGLLDFLGVSRVSAPDNPVAWVTRTGHCAVVTCGQRPAFADGAETLRALFTPDFDPRQVVYLTTDARARVRVTNTTRCRIVSAKFAEQRVELEVEAGEPSLVVLAQTFHHSWRATVDGEPVPLLRANHAFQALEVPAGRHGVRLVYRERNLVLGGVISLLTALGCGLAWRGTREESSV